MSNLAIAAVADTTVDTRPIPSAVVGLRETSTDGMTADFYPFDMKFIGAVARGSSMRSKASTGWFMM
jgi:hypothetical protein